jgi:hypothetical protein
MHNFVSYKFIYKSYKAQMSQISGNIFEVLVSTEQQMLTRPL